MENKWQTVIVTVLAVLVIAVGCFVGFRKNVPLKTVSMEVIQYDELDKKEEVLKIFDIKEKEKIALGKYNGNDVEILKINNNEVEISRVATKYKVIDEKKKKSESYEETVKEKVKYGDSLTININESDPFNSTNGTGRYSYFIKFLN